MPSTAAPKIPCQRCQGTKVQDLPDVLNETLCEIRKLGEASLQQLHDRIGKGLHPTAMNRRVERLMKLELVEKFTSDSGTTKFREV